MTNANSSSKIHHSTPHPQVNLLVFYFYTVMQITLSMLPSEIGKRDNESRQHNSIQVVALVTGYRSQPRRHPSPWQAIHPSIFILPGMGLLATHVAFEQHGGASHGGETI